MIPSLLAGSRFGPFLVAGLGILLLSIMDAMIKSVATAHPTTQIVFMRYACGMPWAIAFYLWSRPPAPSGEMIRAHLLRGVLVTITAFLFFYALATLPLAEAITLAFLSPLFLAVLASLILKEPIQKPVLIAIAVGFVGMGVIVAGKVGGGEFDLVRVLGIAAATTSALAYAANLVLLRKRAQTDPFGLIILFQNLFPYHHHALRVDGVGGAGDALLDHVPRDRGLWPRRTPVHGLGLQARQCRPARRSGVYRARLERRARLSLLRRGPGLDDMGRRRPHRRRLPHGDAPLRHHRGGRASKIMQVSVAWAMRRPLPSTSRASEVAMRDPAWMTLPSQRTRPVSGISART